MKTTARIAAVSLVAALALGACGGDGEGSATTTTSKKTTTTTTVTSTTVAGLEQAAIWPAADTYFATPEAAAKDFVEKTLQVPASLGEFRQGDKRSGEIQVYSPGEGPSPHKVERGLLEVRQLGARNGWFVTSAVNDNATFSSPTHGAKVTDGKLTVAGKARGFEANVVVSARIAGHSETLSKVVTHGGTYETPEPYSVELDLSGAQPGDVVMLLVKGGTGLETDPGDFGAIAVVVE